MDDGGRDRPERDRGRPGRAPRNVKNDRRVDHRDGLGAAQRHLDERPALGFRHRRERDVHEQFVGLHDGFADAGVKLGEGNGALAARRKQCHRRAERHERGDGVVGGRGGDEVACHGGAVADLRRAHFPGGARQRIGARADEFGGGRVVVRHERAEVDHVVFVEVDAGKAGDARDVNQGIHVFARAALQFEHQVGGACHDARASPFFCEQADGIVSG